MATLRLLGVFAVGVAAAAGSSLAYTERLDQGRQPKQDYNSGEYLYRTHCATCHGSTGRGDGPTASTFQRPLSDLTTLSARAGGTFPREDVTRIVRGQKPVPRHTPGDMPEWDRVLRSLEGDDVVARKQIDAIVTYLESIQQKQTP